MYFTVGERLECQNYGKPFFLRRNLNAHTAVCKATSIEENMVLDDNNDSEEEQREKQTDKDQATCTVNFSGK